jgi:hypothetical protein
MYCAGEATGQIIAIGEAYVTHRPQQVDKLVSCVFGADGNPPSRLVAFVESGLPLKEIYEYYRELAKLDRVFRTALLSTGRAYLQSAMEHPYWGGGPVSKRKENQPYIPHLSLNWHGKILMKVRQEVAEETSPRRKRPYLPSCSNKPVNSAYIPDDSRKLVRK